jgi:hypothetical protein
VKSLIYQIVSIVAVGLYFVPMLIVIGKKLWSQVPFRLFALFWLVSAVINVVEFFPLSKNANEIFTVLYNLLDVPFILTIVYFTTGSAVIKKITRLAVPVLIAIGLVNCIIRGFEYESLKYILGGELIIVLSVIIAEIIGKLQKVKHTRQERALLLIYAALLFEYGTYIVIYIFDYFLTGASSTTDNFLVYYFSSMVALTVGICGFLTKGLNTPAKPANVFENSYSKNVADYALWEE